MLTSVDISAHTDKLPALLFLHSLDDVTSCFKYFLILATDLRLYLSLCFIYYTCRLRKAHTSLQAGTGCLKNWY